MEYIVRFLIVVLFLPTIALLLLFLVLALLGNAFYYPIHFIRNGEWPYNSLLDMAFKSIIDYGCKFTNWLNKKGWIIDE